MAVLVALLAIAAPAVGAPSDPAPWPSAPGTDPELTATAQTIRFAGTDRYQTNLALSLALRGKGDFPFDTSDPTSAGAAGLAQATDWWGAASCPRSIIVAAGDTFADVLAAASLSDPNDRSSQPRFERVAAADPLFDPVGGFDRVDTAFAPVIVTDSSRTGATALRPTARLAASDLAKGGCTTGREAIIVGGPAAVPSSVATELLSLGYDEVFRVAGSNRYDTAARVATALGTGTGVVGDNTCDADATDGSVRLAWHGNAVPEFRNDEHSCRLLSKTVVLADGGTGADALAAGWWTSYWQVPVLLTNPDGTLPEATRTALQQLDIDTIVVLGGDTRIPPATRVEAANLATAVAGRFAGVDRYDTSIKMAGWFGGWYPTGDGSDFADDIACVAASAGSGAAAAGWPDALAAGPWCARLGRSGVGSPERALPPAVGADGAAAATGGRRPSHDAVPVLLVAPGVDLPASTEKFLSDAFAPDANWCSGEEMQSCIGPGFAAVLGGTGQISDDVALSLDRLLSGGQSSVEGGRAPRANGFATRLDLSPQFTAPAVSSVTRVCFPAGALRDARWVSLTKDPARRQFLREADVLRTGTYPPSGVSVPTCVSAGDALAPVSMAGVSLSGRVGPVRTFDLTEATYLSLSTPIRQHVASGDAAMDWKVSGPSESAAVVRRGSSSRAISLATLDLHLTVVATGVRATGTLVIETGDGGSFEGTMTGVATRRDGGWLVSGSTVVSGLAGPGTRGGFQASVTTGAVAQLDWTFDGIPTTG